MTNPLRPSLDEQLANLPRDVAPARDLWRGIARRLPQQRRRRRTMALAVAAGVAGACIASALSWAILRGHSVSTAAALAAEARSFDEPRNPSYIAARAALELNFRERMRLLDPATRTRIEASLALIRQAHEDIRKALASDPESPVLEQLWQSTWHDELDLYDNVVQATQPMTRT
jgi:hypothetical protein